MSETEATHYDKYEVQSLLNINTKDEFKYERIFGMYKVQGGKQSFYNILKKIEFPQDVNSMYYDIYYTGPSDVWTLISHKHYKRIDLWWLIALFNDVTDTFTPVEPGLALKIPKPKYVRSILDAIKENV